MLIELSLSSSRAPPAKCPSALASTTVPDAVAPEAIRVCPLTSTGVATAPENASPGWLIFEPTACARRMVTRVPAGITGGGDGAAFTAAAFDASAGAARGFPAAAESVLGLL